MKKNIRNNLILITVLSILYIVVAVNFHKIKFAFSLLKLYDLEKKIESTEKNNDVVDIKFVVDNPLEDILTPVDNEDKPEDTNNEVDSNVDKPVDKIDIPNGIKKEPIIKHNNETEKAPDTSKSYISIIYKYNTIFENLKSSFEAKLDALISQGIKEYSNGELSNTKLANKYLSLGASLEKDSDAKFNNILKEMEKELKSNGHETSIIKNIKDYYTSFKDAKKTDLINRGMKHM